MPAQTPQPDEFGRYRIQTDTGAKVSVRRTPLDGEKVLNEPASDVAGEAIEPEYPAPKSLSSQTTSGQSADPKKEIGND